MRQSGDVNGRIASHDLHSVSPEEAECDRRPVGRRSPAWGTCTPSRPKKLNATILHLSELQAAYCLHSVSPEEAECDSLTRTSLIPTPYASTCERSNPRRIRLLASRGVQHPISLDAAHASGPWSGRCAGPLATGRCLRRFAGLPMPPSGGQNVKDVRC